MPSTSSFTARLVASIADVDPAAWDACANPRGLERGRGGRRAVQPFRRARLPSCARGLRLDRRPLRMDAGACDRRGFCRPDRRRRALLSQEPQPWANMCSIMPGPTPMSAPAGAITRSFRSPRPSRRRPGAGSSSRRHAPEGAREALIEALREVRRQAKASSIHVTFPTAEDAARLERVGFLVRHGEQFHFLCEGFSTFDDFLAALASRKRKAIKRERREALGDDVTIEWADRFVNSARALGCVLQLLHGHGLAQMGPPLSDPLLLRPRRRGDARAHPARDGQARRPLHRRRDQFHRRRRALRPQLGRDRGADRSSISRCAIIRRSNSRWRAA